MVGSLELHADNWIIGTHRFSNEKTHQIFSERTLISTAQSVPSLSIITHFYNQPELVLRQIAHWETMPAEVLDQVEFIIVDDCSEQVPIYPATRLDLKAFRISTPITWNQGGARNLATIHARASWALYLISTGGCLANRSQISFKT